MIAAEKDLHKIEPWRAGVQALQALLAVYASGYQALKGFES